MKLRSEVDELKKHIISEHTTPQTPTPLQLEGQSIMEVPTMPVVAQETVQPLYIPTASMSTTPRHQFDDIEEVKEVESLNLEELEKRNIIRALQQSHNRRRVAAQQLGISERTLYRKIKDYGLEE